MVSYRDRLLASLQAMPPLKASMVAQLNKLTLDAEVKRATVGDDDNKGAMTDKSPSPTPPLFLPLNAKPNETDDLPWFRRELPYQQLVREAPYQQLVQLVQSKMQEPVHVMTSLLKLKCMKTVNPDDVRELRKLYYEVVGNAANFEPQGRSALIGNEFRERLDLILLRELALEWRGIFNDAVDGQNKLDEQPETAQMIRKVMVRHATVFLPMADAMRAAGYVEPTANEFVIRFRLQQRRHQHAAQWHMDNGQFHTYADDGGISQLWNDDNSRSLVTAACLRVDATDSQRPDLWHNCGTEVAVGVPVLRTAALNRIAKRVYELAINPNVCTQHVLLRNRLTKDMFAATEEALEEFQRSTGALQSAGVQTLTLDNGTISDYNDFMFHRANMAFPEGYQRVFFVVTGCPTDNRGRLMDFRTDCTVPREDPRTGQSEVVKFMFEFI